MSAPRAPGPAALALARAAPSVIDPVHEPPVHECAVHGSCGGCPLLGASEAARAEWQRARVEGLARERGLALPPIAWHAAPSAIGYRRRLRLAVGARGQPEFFNREKAVDCAVLAPGVREALAALRARAREAPALLAGFVHLELRDRDQLGRFGLRCTSRPGAPGVPPPRLGAGWLTGVSGGDPREMPCQRWEVAAGVSIDVPLDAFVQINAAVNRQLVAHVVDGLVARGARDFADLFMGAGNFALPLLDRGLEGRGVERHAGAVAAARRVALERSLGAAGLECADARDVAARWALAGEGFDAVVCDPPRAGLGATAGAVGQLARRWLVLCSCHPEALCADLARLTRDGFLVEALSLFDMFPQTRHVEAVAWLERRPSRAGRPSRADPA